ncbi:hypothetical protein ACP70R_009316 [Stipagrostis hirtigluma subsp. patula]
MEREWTSFWRVDPEHNDFIYQSFDGFPYNNKAVIACPCSKCCNQIRRMEGQMASDLNKWGFMPGYARCIQHGEQKQHITVSSLEEAGYIPGYCQHNGVVSGSEETDKTTKLGERQHQEEQWRRLSDEIRLNSIYMRNLSEWSRDFYRYYISLHQFMENIAANMGLPATELPLPLPLPPVYPDPVPSPAHFATCDDPPWVCVTGTGSLGHGKLT